MICYYLKNETVFSHNGLGVLDGWIAGPVVTEELNGIFSLEFDYPLHAKHADGLLPERIVRCPVPDMEPQLFRIAERGDAISGLLHIVAYHVFYDLAQNLIEDTFVVNKNGAQALSQILGAAQFSHPFTGGSNIAVVSSSRLVRRNVAEAILDAGTDNSFLSRWGGEIIRDNFHIALQTVRGSDNGVAIRDKKNLVGYKADMDFGAVATRIMPEGYDGLLLPEKYVDSPRIGDYNTPRIRVIKYDSVKAAVGDRAEDDDAIPLPEAYAVLRALAAREYSAGHIDLPQATYDVSFAPLERTEEYKEFASLEKVSIGDTVRVIHEDDGFDITARMVSYKYDPLTESYISITLGSYAPRFTDVAKELKRVDAVVKQAFDEANYALASANGKNVNYYGSVSPANPRKGDVWFKENGDKIEIWIYETRNGAVQWYALSTDLTQEQLRQELEEAKTLVEEAAAKAEAAAEAAENVIGEVAEAIAETQAQLAAVNQTVEDALTDVEEGIAAQNGKITALVGQIGSRFNIAASGWQQGTLDSWGAEAAGTGYVRTGLVPATPGGKLIAQTPAGGALSAAYWWYADNYAAGAKRGVSLVSKQKAQAIATGTYTYENFAAVLMLEYTNPYLEAITAATTTNPYSGTADYLVLYRITGFDELPEKIEWYGRRETSTQTRAYLYTGDGWWTEIATVTASSNTRHVWDISAYTAGIQAANAAAGMNALHIAFFSVKDSSYAGLYNQSAAPFTANPLHSASTTSATSGVVTAPAGMTHFRARVTTTTPAATFAGIIMHGESRVDTTADTVYAALTMLEENVNLRVAKGDIINQINLSTEGILISGSKVHITGQTTIDNAVIATAHIKDAAITNAKIGSLDASKITTGTLSADRIAAGSITSAKLSIANGFITNAMIADATIQSAKIAALDAAKITTGTLSASRIGANSITADKLATNAIQVGLAGWTSSIRITPTRVSWYDGDILEGYIDSAGMNFYYGTRFVGMMGESYDASNSAKRGIATHLNGQGDYATWAYRTGTSGSYTRFLTFDPRNSLGKGAGISFGTNLWLNGYNLYTSGGRALAIIDNALTNVGTLPSLSYGSGGARVTFSSTHLYLITNGSFYSCTSLMSRVGELISRVNTLISYLNNGWIKSITSGSNGSISWSYYSGTGLSSMSTSLS
jgi:phage minor structural protein